MLIATIIVGGLCAYYFGLRKGALAAVVTLGLLLVALVVPRLALAIYGIVTAGAIVLWQIGSRRPRPPDSVLAARYVRRRLERWFEQGRRKKR